MLVTSNGELNNFLNGGVSGLWLIYGPAASGKTTLALQASLEVAKNKKVVFVDTEEGFSIERLGQMNPEYKELLNNIILIPIKSFEDQHKQLIRLDKLSKNIGLVVVDSFSMFYRKALQKGDMKDVNLKAVGCFRSLKHLVKEGIPVLVTSQVYQKQDGEDVAVGGKMIQNFSDSIIELKIKPRKILFKKPIEKEEGFEINNEGITLNFSSLL